MDRRGVLYFEETPAGLYKRAAGQPAVRLAYQNYFGWADGDVSTASYSAMASLVFDATGNGYFVDGFAPPVRGGPRYVAIRRFTQQGIFSTLFSNWRASPGYVDGGPGVALVNDPAELQVDGAGNVYFSDTLVDTTGATVFYIRTLAASGAVATAAGPFPRVSIAGADPKVNFVVDAGGNIYRFEQAQLTKIVKDGSQSAFAGILAQTGSQDGAGSQARFMQPLGVAADAAGRVYTNDLANNALRVYDPRTQELTFLAQGAFLYRHVIQNEIRMSRPGDFAGMAVDGQGNIYVLDPGDGKLRKVDPRGNAASLPGAGGAVSFASTAGLAVDAAGNLYVADTLRHVIRKVTPDGTMSTVAGVSTSYYAKPGALPGSLGSPMGIALRPGSSGTQLIVSDENSVLSIVLP